MICQSSKWLEMSSWYDSNFRSFTQSTLLSAAFYACSYGPIWMNFGPINLDLCFFMSTKFSDDWPKVTPHFGPLKLIGPILSLWRPCCFWLWVPFAHHEERYSCTKFHDRRANGTGDIPVQSLIKTSSQSFVLNNFCVGLQVVGVHLDVDASVYANTPF